MAVTILKEGIVLTMNSDREILYGGSVILRDNRIEGVVKDLNPLEEAKADRVIDCRNKIVLPGLINTHTHLFQNLLKGLGDDMALDRWLATMTFPAAKNLTPDHCYKAALAGSLESLQSGVTTTLDYMYPHPAEGLSEGVIKAMGDIGIRGILGRGCMDTGEEFGVPREIMQESSVIEKDFIDLWDRYSGSYDGRIGLWLAPAAIWSNSEKNLRMLKELKDTYKTGFTVHISESLFDRQAAEKLHGIPDMDVMVKLGLTGPEILMVHCVYLTEEDQKNAARYGMKVSHNTVSNMYLSSGTAPVPAMLKQGIDVSLGVDGAASNNCQDMIELMKMTALIHKAVSCDPTIMTAEKVLEMATIDGARCLGMEKEIGSLETGKRADILIFDPARSAKSVPLHNPVSTIVYSSSEKNVDTVLVDGRILVEAGKYIGSIKEEKILSDSQAAAVDLARIGGMTNRMEGHTWKNN